jgi:hypothetical protein
VRTDPFSTQRIVVHIPHSNSQLIEKPQLFGFQEERDLVHEWEVGLEGFFWTCWRYVKISVAGDWSDACTDVSVFFFFL